MKKIMILAAIAAMTLASCAKFENSAPTKEVAVPIGFSNYVPRHLTKANDTYASGSLLIPTKQFAVYSYATENGTPFATNALGTKFMDRVAVTFTDNNDNGANNDYSPRRYWPSGNTPDWLTFWAYYPVESTSGIADNPTNGIDYTAPNASGLGSFAFTAATSAGNMVDFMFADVVYDKMYGTTSGEHIALNGEVQFVFKHQLAKIRFQFKTDLNPATDATTKVVLTDAKLYNVKTTGTLTPSYDASASPRTSTLWSNQAIIDENSNNEGDVVYDVTLSGDDIDNTVLTTSLVGGADKDLFLMIPQEMVPSNGTSPQKLVVTWDVKTFDSSSNANSYGETQTEVGTNGLLSITHNTAVLYLDDVTVLDSQSATASNDWAKNQFTTYAITIGPKPILFTATVTPWDAETTGAISVN